MGLPYCEYYFEARCMREYAMVTSVEISSKLMPTPRMVSHMVMIVPFVVGSHYRAGNIREKLEGLVGASSSLSYFF